MSDSLELWNSREVSSALTLQFVHHRGVERWHVAIQDLGRAGRSNVFRAEIVLHRDRNSVQMVQRLAGRVSLIRLPRTLQGLLIADRDERIQ